MNRVHIWDGTERNSSGVDLALEIPVLAILMVAVLTVT